MGRRAALLITAVIIAALGTTLVFFYVKGANDRALSEARPVKVLVAKTLVSSGTSVKDAASAGALVQQRIPAAAAADGALSSIDPIKDQVAITTIVPGQQVLAQMFAGSVQTAVPFRLPERAMAVSFSFADPNRVAGFVQPGSKVAVFVTGALGSQEDRTRVLLPQAQVVAVGPSTLSPGTAPRAANTEQVPRALLTLALDQRQAEKMIFASARGTLYLGLLAETSQVSDRSPGVGAKQLFN